MSRTRLLSLMSAFMVAVAMTAATTATAKPLRMQVTEVAGDTAYLDAGRAAGLKRGTRVRLGRIALEVVDVTETTAAVALGGARVRVGAKAVANVEPGETGEVPVLPTPRPADAFVGQWPDAAPPARSQRPTRVPLGAGVSGGRAHVSVIGRGFAVADPDGVEGQIDARLVASYDLLVERPLSVDADVAVRGFAAGFNSGARVPVMVRAAQIRYGDRYDPRFALGRLRYAATSVGMLDGARASMRVGSNVQVGAFGGIVPDPVSAKPDSSASRFGVEAVYDDPVASWRPRLSLSAYGSTWNGEIDERRVLVTGSASRDELWVDGWAEAQSFASDNPWGARAVELTGAGATAQWRRSRVRIAGDVTFLRPERSLRLAAALPPEWLCAQRPQPGDGTGETCKGHDSWASASLSAGVSGKHWSIDAVGAVGRTRTVTKVYDYSGMVTGEVRLGRQRVFAGASGGKASFAGWMGAHVGVGVAVSPKFDVVARYQPELVDYIASTEAGLLQSGMAEVRYAAAPNLDLAVIAAATTGFDRDALSVLTVVAWRPLP